MSDSAPKLSEGVITKGTGVEKESVESKRSVRVEDDAVSDSSAAILDVGRRRTEEKRLVRKLDMRLLPTIILIFIMNYIDRTAVTTARLKGLEQDLGLSDIQYDTVVAILYVSYCPAQIPSNMVLCLVSVTHLFNKALNYELAFRSAILYGGLLVSNAFGSGAITICVGFFSMWALPDYPVNTRWLSPTERRLAQARLAEDAGEADQDREGESMWTGLKLACKDVKVHIFSLMGISQLLGLSFVNFFPTPPWIFATIVCCLNAFHADRSGERFLHLAVPWWGVMVGYIIGVSTFSVGGRYVSMFLMASGYAGFALTLVWVSNAIPRPPTKRAAAMGIVNGFGNIGNLCVLSAQWGPAYHQSMFIGIAALALSSCLGFLLRWMLKRENERLDRDELGALKGANRPRIEEFARLEGITIEEAMERKRGFRYLY
ncbi:MFS general substrate transporter [Fomitiporia mediterranea MF3/22]|uniref:MFS general substrate transporter n=1 Tax=Fomitiporia mediterranea (strain MF3/22) TaxID=694068 RepID=UPI00044084D2|nr:MFS general substrate transporter [Fomitiporia mediterranea MF3/22]EJD07977.1 MFS general substrate transporter [Fomitiporia mediterranea MF3/22]